MRSATFVRFLFAFTLSAAMGSGLSACAKRETAEMTHAALAGDWKQARELHLKLFPLSRAMFLETNPIPVKEALAMMGKIAEAEYRLPMCGLSEANRPRLKAVLASLGLVKG